MSMSPTTRGATVLVPLVAVLAVVAGCVDGDSGPSDAQGLGQAAFDADTGGIQGVVIDEDMLPVEGAAVGIQDPPIETVTDESGGYALNHVPPGEHRVHVSALGYAPESQTVAVEAGQASEAEFSLEVAAVEQPHYVVQIGDGKIACGVRAYPGAPLAGAVPPGWYTGVAVCGVGPVADVQDDRFLVEYDLLPDVHEMYLEMEWRSTQATGRGLSVVLEHNGYPNNPDYTFGRATGESPLLVYANETKMMEVEESSEITCLEEACEVYTRVFAEANTTNADWPMDPPEAPVFGPMHQRLVDVGIVWEQPFTQYLTTFHRMEMPEDFTAREEG